MPRMKSQRRFRAKRPASMQDASGGLAVMESQTAEATCAWPSAEETSASAPLERAEVLSVTMRQLVPRAASASACAARQSAPV